MPRRAWLIAGGVCSVLAGLGIAQAVTGGSWLPGQSAALNHAGGPARHRTAHPTTAATPSPSTSGYANPLRSVRNLVPQRIDMGVDFAGAGPVYALGAAVITNARSADAGWPGGGWITYRMTSGPAAGLSVYLAEDVRPTVRVGDQVTSATVIANMSDNGDGIEFGWATANGVTAESQLAAAGEISGDGAFPTKVGVNFDDLLIALGAPAAYNHGDAPHGLLPAGYQKDWTGLGG